jgi:hypothetical protein
MASLVPVPAPRTPLLIPIHPAVAVDAAWRGGRSASRLLRILALAWLCACRTPEDLATRAITYVVSERLPPTPDLEGRELERFVSEVWESTDPLEPVPMPILEATGLPSRPYASLPSDSAIIILDLFRPRVISPDSIFIHVEWLVFDSGRTGTWGQDWDFQLSCRGGCEVVRRYGPGHMDFGPPPAPDRR